MQTSSHQSISYSRHNIAEKSLIYLTSYQTEMVNNITNYKSKGNKLFRPIISSKYTLRIQVWESGWK